MAVEKPSNEILNYLGVSFVLLSTVFYIQVKNETKSELISSEYEPILSTESPNLLDSTNECTHSSEINYQASEETILDRLSTFKKRVLGVGLCIFSGMAYSQAFTPVVYIRDNYHGASNNSLDYLFSFYTGIFVTSLFYFIIYAMVKKNKPILYNQIVLPGLASGKII